MPHSFNSWVIVVIVWLIYGSTGTVNTSAQRLQFTSYTQEDGLVSNEIETIYQDHTGYIWIASKDVLHRFDGMTFKVYEQFQKGYLRQEIRSITEDRAGNLWVSAGGRLYLYDEERDFFSEYELRGVADSTDLASHTGIIYEIYVLDENTLLVASNKLLIRVNIAQKTWETVLEFGIQEIATGSQGRIWCWPRWNRVIALNASLEIEEEFSNSPEAPDIIPSMIHQVFETPDGTLWIIGNDIRYATPEALKTGRFTSLLGEDKVVGRVFTEYAFDKQGYLWIGDGLGQLLQIDPLSREIRYEQHVESGDARGVTAFLIDRQGLMWIGVERDGIKKSKLALPGIIQVDPVESVFSTRMMSQFAEDTNGYIWTGIDGSGLSRYDPESDRVDCFLTSDNSKLRSDAIVEVFATSRGTLLVGAFPQGVYELIPETCTLTTLDWLASFRINDLYEDEQGLFWFADNDGLIAFDLDTQTRTLYPIPDDFRRIFSLNLKHWNDFLVISSWNDVTLFNLKTKTYQPEQWAYSSAPTPTSLPHELVYMSEVDQEGVLWLGTDHGLVRYDESSGTFEVLLKEAGLPGLSIRGMVLDQEGYLWLGTNNGIAQFDPVSRTTVQTYTPDDGLQGFEFNRASAFKDSKGRLYFGGYKGFNVIDPGRLADASEVEVGPVVITSVHSLEDETNRRLGGQGQPLSSNSEVEYRIDTLPREAIQDSLSLRDIRFSFAHLDFQIPGKNKFHYRLVGGASTWHTTDAPTITYHDLSPGAYRFEVKGINAAGLAGENTASYAFTVYPYWYETRWFFLLIGIVALGGVGLMYRWRVRKVQVRNETLRKLVDEQTQEIREKNAGLEEANREIEFKNTSLMAAYEEAQVINDNLIKTNQTLEDRSGQLREALEKNKEILGITAHDLKNPLGGILGLAEIVLEDMEEGIQSTYDSVADNMPLLKDEAERMLQIIKDLLDRHREGEEVTLKKERVVLGDIVSAVVRWNTKQAADKEIEIHYHADEIAIVDVDVMAIQRVLDNYVSNAVKYSFPGSNVWISVHACDLFDDQCLQVSVRDEGPGLTDEDRQKVFGKMQRLSAKPTGGEHSTGLGLYIVKQLVEAHGGTVGVDSVHGEGATFWFTLAKSELNEEMEAMMSLNA